jgi:hypothetical protein
MSQRNVERVIGRLITDEPFRRRFGEDPAAAIEELVGSGAELTDVERRALAGVDVRLFDQVARALDPRLQKIDCCRGPW